MIEACIQLKMEGNLSTNNNGGCLLSLPFVASFAMLFLIGFLGFATVSSTETSMPDAAPPAEAGVSGGSTVGLLFVSIDAPTTTEIDLLDAPSTDAELIVTVESGFKPYVVGRSSDNDWVLVYYFVNEVPATAWTRVDSLGVRPEQLDALIILDPTAIPDFTIYNFNHTPTADIALLGE